MWTRDLQLAGRVERWKAGYMWTRHTHRHHHTTLLTCGNTCTNTTNENTGHHIENSWREHIFTQTYTASKSYYIQLHMFEVKKTAYSNKCLGQKNKNPEHGQPGGKQLLNHKRSFILECKRPRDRKRERGGRTERDLSLHQDVLSMWDWRIACQNSVVSTCPFSQQRVCVHVHLHMYSIYV